MLLKAYTAYDLVLGGERFVLCSLYAPIQSETNREHYDEDADKNAYPVQTTLYFSRGRGLTSTPNLSSCICWLLLYSCQRG